MSDFDLYFFRASERLGISPKVALRLIRARRIAADFPRWRRNQREVAKIRTRSAFSRLIKRQEGYSVFETGTLPNVSPTLLEGAVAQAAQLADERGDMVAKSKKPFFANVMTADDFDRCDKIIELANHPTMMDIAAGYLGTSFKLRSVGVYVSEKNYSLYSSQLFHYDMNDLHQLKCFINVNMVTAENGPLTFVPADVSEAAGLSWGTGQFTDETVFASVPRPALIELVGPPGTGAFVDTSRCLHFGSRTKTERRVVIMIQYTPDPDVSLKAKRKQGKKGAPVLIGED